MKPLFEEFGGIYTLGKGYIFNPNLTIAAIDRRPIEKWGRMHRAYLEEKHPILYLQLMLNGTLYKHLANVDARASEMLERLVKQMAEQEGVAEHQKAEQPME